MAFEAFVAIAGRFMGVAGRLVGVGGCFMAAAGRCRALCGRGRAHHSRALHGPWRALRARCWALHGCNLLAGTPTRRSKARRPSLQPESISKTGPAMRTGHKRRSRLNGQKRSRIAETLSSVHAACLNKSLAQHTHCQSLHTKLVHTGLSITETLGSAHTLS